MNFDHWCDRAAALRELPLENVLRLRGAVPDCHDKSKWHTEQGPVSITGPKFINWRDGQAGGGAIDLVMHLADTDFLTAFRWLEQNLGRAIARASVTSPSRPPSFAPEDHRELRLPVRDDHQLDVVRRYLTRRRHLAAALLDPLFQSGRIYADSRANAVFLMVAGKANRPVGAELRGTGPRVWRGMAPGSHKDLGYFWIGPKSTGEIVICESAIDAISCFQIFQRVCISTAGVRANPRWLAGLITRGYKVHCGFDADRPGDTAASQMIALYPAVKRLRPPAHDWNDALTSRR